MPASSSPDFQIRPLTTATEYAACVELQRETWGREFTDLVPPTILKITQRLGGVAAGAFDPSGRLLGFVFGMTGLHRGRSVHWSDMLAVRAERRDQGIGRALKAYQRDLVRALGVDVMYWTFDPLQARNARLNLMTLGADVDEYVEDMYGVTDSDLHRGLGTDRFIVAWRLDGAPARVLGVGVEGAPLLNAGAPGTSVSPAALLADRPPAVRVQIPLDIGAVQRESLDLAFRWRLATRDAFTAALAAGYRVDGFLRDEAAARGFYLLRHAPST